MSRNVIFNASTELVAKVAEQIRGKHEDSMLVVAPVSGSTSIHAPTTKGKYKGYHRLKVEVWIPEDAIVGDSTLSDFGIVTLLRLPKNRVKEHLKD